MKSLLSIFLFTASVVNSNPETKFLRKRESPFHDASTNPERDLGSSADDIPFSSLKLGDLDLPEVFYDQVDIISGADDLRPTESDEGFEIERPRSRAIVRDTLEHQKARVMFQYRGPSDTDVPFDSGEFYRDIGVELAQADPCNHLSILWKVGPVEKISVLLKSNPGQHSLSECGDGGYTSLVSDVDYGIPINSALDWETHRLQANLYAMGGDMFYLMVFADCELVYSKLLPYLVLRGPAGLHTDNGSFIFRFFAENT